MSEKNGKVCCNCRHNIRKGEIGSIDCYCDIDNRYISYIDTFEHWCRHWAKEKNNAGFSKREQREIHRWQ